jgi:hypothetical protein
LGLDPDFATNGYIYVYWSPVYETNPTQNILSRYKMTGDHVDVSSELRLLSINTQVGCLENGLLGEIKYCARLAAHRCGPTLSIFGGHSSCSSRTKHLSFFRM